MGDKTWRAPMCRIAFVGDVMLGRLVSRELQRHTPEYFWSDVGPLLQSCDAVVANLECAITHHARQWAKTYKTFHFRAEPTAIDVLKAGNIRAVSLANNHVLDFEVEGLVETIRLLESAGIAHAGAGADKAAARRPAFFQAGPLKLALFACVDHEEPFAAGPAHPGTAYVDPGASRPAPFPGADAIAQMKSQGADLVLLSTHFGPNMVLHPSQAIRDFRHMAVEAGIDIVHGHSAHVFQGVELRNRSLILHDTGDILDDYLIDPRLHNDWSFVFIVEAGAKGVTKLRLVPVFLEFAHVRLASEHEAQPMFARMIELSSAFGTHFSPGSTGRSLEMTVTDFSTGGT